MFSLIASKCDSHAANIAFGFTIRKVEERPLFLLLFRSIDRLIDALRTRVATGSTSGFEARSIAIANTLCTGPTASWGGLGMSIATTYAQKFSFANNCALGESSCTKYNTPAGGAGWSCPTNACPSGVGVDMDALAAATAGCISGVWSTSATATPTVTATVSTPTATVTATVSTLTTASGGEKTTPTTTPTTTTASLTKSTGEDSIYNASTRATTAMSCLVAVTLLLSLTTLA